ncbi:hypothetical protein MPH_08956, partial [Macrophomina phaseolina MS6]
MSLLRRSPSPPRMLPLRLRRPPRRVDRAVSAAAPLDSSSSSSWARFTLERVTVQPTSLRRSEHIQALAVYHQYQLLRCDR